MSRKPIANPLLDVDGDFDPVNLVNPYSFAAAGPTGTAALSSVTLGSARTDNYWVGFKFTVGAASKTLVSLGRWKYAGNGATHTLQLRNSGGSVVVSTSVDLAAGGAGDWVWSDVSPTTLSASQTYYIISDETGSDEWGETANATIDSAFAGIASCYDSDSTGAPTDYAGGQTFVPVNFKFT